MRQVRNMKRCKWATVDKAYTAYHDTEWGVPVHDDNKLFEMLILEGTQAGLSWLTVLKKRENYRKAYNEFDPVKIAQWDQEKIESLLKNSGIIRNRLKIKAAKTNARAFIETAGEFGSFDAFIWSFVGSGRLSVLRPYEIPGNLWGKFRLLPWSPTE
jgi:DNA-3-methyladenine glycosylase I